MFTIGQLALCGAPPGGCGFRGKNWRSGVPISRINSDGYPECQCGSEMRVIHARDNGERVAAYQEVARCFGTRIMLAERRVAPRICGAVAFHPLVRGQAIEFAVELRKLGAEAKINSKPAIGFRDERLFVRLSGCSFAHGDVLDVEGK